MAAVEPRDPAWLPAGYATDEVRAVKAVAAGVASEDQQKRCIDFIINNLAGTYELSFRSDGHGGERETAFAEGRRYVGLQLVKFLKMNTRLLDDMDNAKKKDGSNERSSSTDPDKRPGA